MLLTAKQDEFETTKHLQVVRKGDQFFHLCDEIQRAKFIDIQTKLGQGQCMSCGSIIMWVEILEVGE